ncbi:hypothetical protein IQ62_11460 [Streptomyces scabiei]|nr:hypothetical protein IQ62_11460 [Streptomyces scabiei]
MTAPWVLPEPATMIASRGSTSRRAPSGRWDVNGNRSLSRRPASFSSQSCFSWASSARYSERSTPLVGRESTMAATARCASDLTGKMNAPGQRPSSLGGADPGDERPWRDAPRFECPLDPW